MGRVKAALRRRFFSRAPGVKARCPKSGHILKPFWQADPNVRTIGAPGAVSEGRDAHQVLVASCPCGWFGRVNNPRVIVQQVA